MARGEEKEILQKGLTLAGREVCDPRTAVGGGSSPC